MFKIFTYSRFVVVSSRPTKNTDYISNMLIEATLQKLGLNEKEVGVYLSLLKHGEGTGYLVAKDLGMKRSSVYFLLDELRKKGLVTRIPKSGRQVFIPKHPKILMEDTQRLMIGIETIIPKLLALTPTNNEPKVTFLEGDNAYFEAMEERMRLATKETESVGFFAYVEPMTPELEEINLRSFGAVSEKSQGVRALTVDHPVIREYVSKIHAFPQYRVRLLPFDKYSSRTSIEAISNVVFIYANDANQIIKIENENLAHTVKQIFEMMWSYTEILGCDEYPKSSQKNNKKS